MAPSPELVVDNDAIEEARAAFLQGLQVAPNVRRYKVAVPDFGWKVGSVVTIYHDKLSPIEHNRLAYALRYNQLEWVR
jgi:hypothetical protein